MTSATTAATPRPGPDRVAVLEDILSENDRVADANRRALVAAGVRSVNLMSSPGAGQDDAAEAHPRTQLGPAVRIGILEGDIATSLDADRLDRTRPRSRSSTRARVSAASATSTR